MSKQIKLNQNLSNLMKGLYTTNGANLTELREVDTEYTGVLAPSLLTNILAPQVNTHKTRTFAYDEEDQGAHLPGGKRYDKKGPFTEKNTLKQHTFAIPSYGLQYSISCEEYAEKRKTGTTDEFMDFEYLNTREQFKVMQAFDLLTELNIGTILTTDTPDFLGAPITPENYYTEIVGTPRGAATDVDFSALSPTQYRGVIEECIDEQAEVAAQKQRSVSRWVKFCGKNYFNSVVEKEAQENLPRDIRGRDLAQEGVPTMSDGEFNNVRAIEGSDGVIYIKYTASILGTKIIDDDDAYLVPVGVENMWTIETAPASSLDTMNKEAQPMYMWSEETRREAMFEFESNRLYMNRVPQLIKKFTKTG